MVLTYAGLLDYNHNSDSELEASASQALTLRQQTTCTLKPSWFCNEKIGKKVGQKTKKKLDSKQRIHA